MEDYTSISKLEELTINYQKKAESSRDWVHHLQVVCYNLIILIRQLIKYEFGWSEYIKVDAILIKGVLLKDTNCWRENCMHLTEAPSYFSIGSWTS